MVSSRSCSPFCSPQGKGQRGRAGSVAVTMRSSFSLVPGGILTAASQKEETPGASALGKLRQRTRIWEPCRGLRFGNQSWRITGLPSVSGGFSLSLQAAVPSPRRESFSWPCCPAFLQSKPRQSLEQHTEEYLFRVDNLVVGFSQRRW